MTQDTKISSKHIAVVEAYLGNGYKREDAVIAAGYSPARARQTASDIFKRPEVKAYLAGRMRELQMDKEEALLRLAQHASGDMRQFIGLTMAELKRHPNAWLIKELKYDTVTPKYWKPKATQKKQSEPAPAQPSQAPDPNQSTESAPATNNQWEDLPPTFVYVDSIKLYDAQAALIQVLRQHQLASGQPTEIMNVPQLAELSELLKAAGKDFGAVVARMVERLKAEAE